MTGPEWQQIEPFRMALDIAQKGVDAWWNAEHNISFSMTDAARAEHNASEPRLRADLDLARARYEAALDALAKRDASQGGITNKTAGVIVTMPDHNRSKPHHTRGGKDWR